MTRIFALLLTVSVLLVGLTACSDNPNGSNPNSRDDDAPPTHGEQRRAKPGYVGIRDEPLEQTEEIEPEVEAVYQPYARYSIQRLGTVDTIVRNGTELAPAEGETFYVLDLKVELMSKDVQIAHELGDLNLDRVGFPASINTSRSGVEELDFDAMETALRNNEDHAEARTIVAAGSPEVPPVLQVTKDSRIIEFSLADGQISGPYPMIDPVSLELSEDYSDTATTDRALEKNVRINHQAEFQSARLTSFLPGTTPVKDENIVAVRANWKTGQQGTDSPGPIYEPSRTVRLIDAEDNVYEPNHLVQSNKEVINDGKTSDGIHGLDPGKSEKVRISFTVPRGLTKFTLVYQPLIGYHPEADIHLRQQRIPLDFGDRKSE